MSDPETPTDPPAAPTGTDAGVAELIERLHKARCCDASSGCARSALLTEAAIALAQQATQLQEARRALDEAKAGGS